MALRESDLQEAIITWSHTMTGQYPCLAWLHAVPNGGYRSGREAVSLKRQGVKPGILDLALDVARGGYHGLRIELKRPGGKCKAPSVEQSKYIAFLTDNGYYCLVSNDFALIKKNILDYLKGDMVRGTNA